MKSWFLSCIFALALSVANQAASLSDGLIAHYTFTGNANDSSGQRRHLTNFNAVLDFDKSHSPNGAFAFNGLTSILVETNGIEGPIFTNGSFTLTCWVKIQQHQPGIISLVRKDGEANLLLSDGKIYSEAFRTNVQYRAFGPEVPVGTWCMLAVTWNGSNFLQFLNAEQQILVEDNFPREVPYSVITIGGSLIYEGRLDGVIDDVRVYNRALTPAELREISLLEAPPRVSLMKAFTTDYHNLLLGAEYQAEASTDGITWTNWGLPFTATNSTHTNTVYHRINTWDKLLFRLKKVNEPIQGR